MIVVTFQEQSEDKEIDKNQKRCIGYVMDAKPLNLNLPEDDDVFRQQVWYFVESSPFEVAIIGFVFLTTGVMMMKHFDQTTAFDELESIVNFAAVGIFTVEGVLRVYAYGFVSQNCSISNFKR